MATRSLGFKTAQHYLRRQIYTMTQPKITLYTNHVCPFAHRAHIALKETGLKYDEVIIDLDKPREPWYLEINPVSSRFDA